MNSQIPTYSALALTIVFLVVSAWLLKNFGVTGDHAWDHAVVVYNALTSIAFTAVGVLLGAKVQQIHVDKANADATLAKGESAAKTAAIKTALTHLNSANGQVDEAGRGIAPASTARAVLLQALS